MIQKYFSSKKLFPRGNSTLFNSEKSFKFSYFPLIFSIYLYVGTYRLASLSLLYTFYLTTVQASWGCWPCICHLLSSRMFGIGKTFNNNFELVLTSHIILHKIQVSSFWNIGRYLKTGPKLLCYRKYPPRANHSSVCYSLHQHLLFYSQLASLI